MNAAAAPRRHWSRPFFVALLLGLTALLLYQLYLLLVVVWLSIHDPASSAVMRATLRDLRQQDPKAALQHEWVPYERISPHLKRAVIASEDSNFFDHGGVEWEAIRRAWEYNRRQADEGGSRRRGGSTITQQLAKNLFLSNSRSYLRKGQELVLTYMIENIMSKRRILELYLNLAQWGTHTFGAQAAARHHFQRDAARLTPAQAARLAAMLPNPTFYDQRGNTRYLQSRTQTIQQRMRLISVPE